jgi:ATP-dependent DNA helicase RecQ
VRAVYSGERRVTLRRLPEAHDPTTRSGRPGRGPQAAHAAEPHRGPHTHSALYEALRGWRRALASEQKVPPYVIFHDRTLLEIAAARPASAGALAALPGVGQGKLDRYGDAVLKVVRES